MRPAHSSPSAAMRSESAPRASPCGSPALAARCMRDRSRPRRPPACLRRTASGSARSPRHGSRRASATWSTCSSSTLRPAAPSTTSRSGLSSPGSCGTTPPRSWTLTTRRYTETCPSPSARSMQTASICCGSAITTCPPGTACQSRFCTAHTTPRPATSCFGWCALRRATCCACRTAALTQQTASSLTLRRRGTASQARTTRMSRSSSPSFSSLTRRFSPTGTTWRWACGRTGSLWTTSRCRPGRHAPMTSSPSTAPRWRART
mmetsp:Transcript_13898/g.34963  ORF Transcript_13898/g.34963 Transcript_13898/m.34963 type:complete len:263 (+) Transcript_13898:838-1626(+)